MTAKDIVSVRYIVHDVAACIEFYTKHFGFTVGMNAPPAFADVTRGNLRLLLSGPLSSAGRTMADGETHQPETLQSLRRPTKRRRQACCRTLRTIAAAPRTASSPGHPAASDGQPARSAPD